VGNSGSGLAAIGAVLAWLCWLGRTWQTPTIDTLINLPETVKLVSEDN
jgi:hypothetical protein